MPNGEKSILRVVYRHTGTRYNFVKFLNKLELVVHELNKRTKQYYFCGDININLFNTNCAQIHTYQNTLYSLGSKQLIENATRLSDTPSLLDHFYSNTTANEVASHIILSDISHHLPIVTFMKKLKPIKKSSNIYTRNMKCFIADQFLEDLEN